VRGGFNQNPKLKQKYENLHKQKLKEYVDDLREFLETETDLKEEHTKHIMARIRSFERKVLVNS
jgi:CO dehydrogenase/acetyl-CoA synthase alpha subunit